MTDVTDMGVAEEFERAVAAKLRQTGFRYVYPFGQGLLTKDQCNALRQCRSRPALRWLPDMIAVGREGVVFFDAKRGSGDPSRGPWFIVNLDTLNADEVLAPALGGPIYYVLNDYTWVNAADVVAARRDGLVMRGPDTGRGSGRPYVQVPRSLCRPWIDLWQIAEDIGAWEK